MSCLLFEARSHVACAGLKLTMEQRVTLNLWSHCPHVSSAGWQVCTTTPDNTLLRLKPPSLVHARQALFELVMSLALFLSLRK